MLESMGKIRTARIGEQLGSLGEFIAAQRRTAQLSLRQLAEQTGISNPYLSQIERGLRKPSAEVLLRLSKALRVSAETLYVRAGILNPDDHPGTSVEMAMLADTAITERQKRVLMDVYTSFVKENEDRDEWKARNDQARPDERGRNQRPLAPHHLARAPRGQERWGVSSPPPGLT